VLSERNLDETVAAILRGARTGDAGDGLIFVYPVDEAVRIRTGERGRDAVMYPGDIDDLHKNSQPDLKPAG
jgi:nitrogen regulatory protein P-II 1